MNEEQVKELLYQALETEIGGQDIYKTAIRCANNDELREEWQKYLEETENHERILRETFGRIGLDPEVQTPGREVVHAIGASLVQAMEQALGAGKAAAQLVAAECVVMAESKDHANWELIGEIAKKSTGEQKAALKEAHGEVEDQEDEHLYHTMGWARELWMESLGLPAVIPPPEEKKHVKSAIGAARAKNARGQMTNGRKKAPAKSGSR